MSTACSVCLEEYGKSGEKLPKLLPCTHTLCVSCLSQLLKGRFLQCPECRKTHEVDVGGVRAFPTNRYVVEMLDLAKKAAARKEALKAIANEDEDMFCDEHQKPLAMFCFELNCGKLLCPACPISNHAGHKLVGLSENINDIKELDEMKKDLDEEQDALETSAGEMNVKKMAVLQDAEKVQEKIDAEVNAILEKAAKLKFQIQQKSDESVEKVDEVKTGIEACVSTGVQIKKEFDNWQQTVALSHCVKNLQDTMQRFVEYKKTAMDERNKSLTNQLCDPPNFSAMVKPDWTLSGITSEDSSNREVPEISAAGTTTTTSHPATPPAHSFSEDPSDTDSDEDDSTWDNRVQHQTELMVTAVARARQRREEEEHRIELERKAAAQEKLKRLEERLKQQREDRQREERLRQERNEISWRRPRPKHEEEKLSWRRK